MQYVLTDTQIYFCFLVQVKLDLMSNFIKTSVSNVYWIYEFKPDLKRRLVKAVFCLNESELAMIQFVN